MPAGSRTGSREARGRPAGGRQPLTGRRRGEPVTLGSRTGRLRRIERRWPSAEPDVVSRAQPVIPTDPKPRPNRERYFEILRRITPEARLNKAFEFTQLSRDLLRAGLAARFPELTPAELHTLYLARLAECRKRND